MQIFLPKKDVNFFMKMINTNIVIIYIHRFSSPILLGTTGQLIIYIHIFFTPISLNITWQHTCQHVIYTCFARNFFEGTDNIFCTDIFRYPCVFTISSLASILLLYVTNVELSFDAGNHSQSWPIWITYHEYLLIFPGENIIYKITAISCIYMSYQGPVSKLTQCSLRYIMVIFNEYFCNMYTVIWYLEHFLWNCPQVNAIRPHCQDWLG